MKLFVAAVGIWGMAISAQVFAASTEVLVQVDAGREAGLVRQFAQSRSESAESLGFNGWLLVKSSARGVSYATLKSSLLQKAGVRFVQPNYKLGLANTFNVPRGNESAKPSVQRADPSVPSLPSPSAGMDPMYSKQWGMLDIGAQAGWGMAPATSNIIVAVIDTGVDYTHEDLNGNIWRNPGETGLDAQGRDKASNGVDDDANGFVDDQIGWDFAANDNRPFDTYSAKVQEILQGANPGHGTHCAGNVAAVGNNTKGVSGVAPNVKIMALRFLTEKGEGTTADGVKAVKYAVDNGARVLSNSWGSSGDDPNDPAGNQALKDVITYSAAHNVLFVAAAGNGDPKTGVGYDNDTSAIPAVPASYDNDNIVSVAAIDKVNALGKFSNWGARTVDIGAPGVAVFSTMAGSRYSDIVADIFIQKITWDGTSMATPHVAGAAGLYLSKHPNATWREVKDALLRSAKPISALSGKVVSNGKLDVETLMRN